MKNCMQKSNFWSILLHENDIFCFSRASWKNMILKWESYGESDSEVKLYNVSDFESKIWNVPDFEKKVAFKNDVINHVTLRNRQFLHFPCLFETQHFGRKFLQCVRLGIQKSTKNQMFHLKNLQCVRIWTEAFTTCHTLNFKKLKRGRNWKKIALRNSRFELCYPVKPTFLHFSCLWEMPDF